MVRTRPLRVGVLGMEFFDSALGRMGGFGWAARQLVDVLHGHGDPPVEVVLLAGSQRHPDGLEEGESHGVPILFGTGDRLRDARRLWRRRLDVLVAVDWGPRYVATVRALPRTPLLIWSRDPWPPSVGDRLDSLRLPDGTPAAPDTSFAHRVDGSVARVLRSSARARRPVIVATTAPFLVPRVVERFGVDVADDQLLPNPLTIARTGPPAADPVVAFVGRLDPVKRPWLVVELARRHPGVRFELAGGRYVDAWEPADLPPNVVLLDHIDEAAKADLLSRAWVLVNTSIHEGLPVSMCEALRVGTPLLATVDPDGLATRFGVFAGAADGDGRELVGALDRGLRSLLDDDDRRIGLGADAATWARSHHSVRAFGDRLVALFDQVGAGAVAAGLGRAIDDRLVAEHARGATRTG